MRHSAGLIALVPLGMWVSKLCRRAWLAEAEAEADKLDPNWRLDDLIRAQEAIEPRQNSGCTDGPGGAEEVLPRGRG